MESEWELDRIRLYQLRRAHPDWTLPRLAQELNRSLSWVKKWLKRFREASQVTLETFKSRSRAPHNRARQVVEVVRDAILSLRDALKARYGRVVGAKTILYHLHHDPLLQAQGVYLPRSSRTIWQVLKEGGRIPTRLREHYPIERPEAMQHWEMDFGQLGDRFEFLTVVDRGTSILVNTQTQPHYNAEIALRAVATLFIVTGYDVKYRIPAWKRKHRAMIGGRVGRNEQYTRKSPTPVSPNGYKSYSIEEPVPQGWAFSFLTAEREDDEVIAGEIESSHISWKPWYSRQHRD